ncbi:MAG: phosphatase domain-containing protein [Bdellovibrionales bacterium]
MQVDDWRQITFGYSHYVQPVLVEYVFAAYNKPMSDWRSKAEISGDVCFFEYVTSEKAYQAKEVFVWDLDKTYLDTHFESVKGMYRTIVEKAFQKKNVPGTGSLVRTLTSDLDHPFPIFFITASPPQMEEKIRQKLELDGIKPYGIFFKDNLINLRPGRLSRLTQQIGFKIQALLQLRSKLNPEVKQILWGDDSESDAIIYSLYSDICSRRLKEDDLYYVLQKLKVRGVQASLISAIQSKLPEMDPVQRIYINLATDTDPDYYYKFGRRTLPTYNTFQVGLDLYQDGHLSSQKLCMVAEDMITNYGFYPEELEKSLNDLVARKVLTEDKVGGIIPSLKKDGLLSDVFELSKKPISKENFRRTFQSNSQSDSEQWVPEFIDYINDFR